MEGTQMIKCPCVRECPNRKEGCTKECKAYKAYAALKEEEYHQRALKAMVDDACSLGTGRMVRARKKERRER